MNTLDQYIAQLYQSTTTYSADQFRERALRALHEVIPFDAALWATGSFENRSFHTTTLLELPQAFADKLMMHSSINPITEALYKHVGEAVDMADVVSDQTFFKSPVYQYCFHPYGISRILSSGHLQQRSGVFTILSLYRKDKEQRFNAEEKGMQNRAIFHLLNANSQNCFLHLKEQRILSPNRCAAICDKHGYIHQAEHDFIELLDSAFPHREVSKIPFAITPDSVEIQGAISAKSSCIGDLFCVEIWPSNPVDTLTSRERQVVDRVVQGMTFKEVAKQLELSPSTVSNHLYRVYNKLDINSRSELAMLFH